MFITKKRSYFYTKIFIFSFIFTSLFFLGINYSKEKIIYLIEVLNISRSFSSQNIETQNVDVKTLELLQSEITILKNEKKKLEDSLGMVTLDTKLVPVKLILDKSQIFGDFYVSKNSKVDFYEGMYIYGKDNVIVGKIDSVDGVYARVTRLGVKENFVGVITDLDEFVELKSSGLGLYKGKIPKISEVTEGMTVTLKGFPKGVVGMISNISENSTSLNDIYVRVPYNLNDLEIFYVKVE